MNKVKERIRDQVLCQVGGQVFEQISERVRGRTWKQVRVPIREQVLNHVRDKLVQMNMDMTQDV